MSLELSSGVIAKTGRSFPGEEHYVNLYGEQGDETRSMEEAVGLIRDILNDSRLKDDRVFQRFLGYLRSMYLQTLPEQGWGVRQRLQPATEGFDLSEDPGPDIDIMDHRLSRNEVMAFIDYVFTNTSLESLADPRIHLLGELQAGQ